MSADLKVSPKTLELVGQIIQIARSDNIRRGERLFPHRFANRLGVSRGPVHSAMQILVTKGIAEAVPNKGFVLVDELDTATALEALGSADDESEAHYLRIARDRLNGALPDVVSEAELMRRYELKRAAVLRLLDRIASEGWIERSRGYGWRFTQTLNSARSYGETGRLRMMIEPGGILEPAFQWRADLMVPVREHQQRLLENPGRFTPPELFRFGCEIHEAVAECSGNAILLETLKRLNRLRRLFAYSFITDLQVEKHAREHLKLLDLLEAGQHSDAAELMKHHLRWSGGGDQIG